MNNYWNHNVAYHPWILKQIQPESRVLDVGCGDGLLVEKLAGIAGQVVGIEPHEQSVGACIIVIFSPGIKQNSKSAVSLGSPR